MPHHYSLQTTTQTNHKQTTTMNTQHFLDRIDYSSCDNAWDVYEETFNRVSENHTTAWSEEMANETIHKEWGIEGDDFFSRDYDRRVVLEDCVVNIRITECFADPGSEDYVYIVSTPGMDYGVFVEDGVNMAMDIKRFDTPEGAVAYAQQLASHYKEAEDCYDSSKTQQLCAYAVIDDTPAMVPIWTSHYFYRDDF